MIINEDPHLRLILLLFLCICLVTVGRLDRQTELSLKTVKIVFDQTLMYLSKITQFMNLPR